MKKRKPKKPAKEALSEKPFDEKTSVLPKWLIKRGITCHSWDHYTGKDYLIGRLREEKKEHQNLQMLFEEAKRKFGKKLYRAFCKKFGWEKKHIKRGIKEVEDEIKNFTTIYFKAQDVEKAFRKLREQYEQQQRKA